MDNVPAKAGLQPKAPSEGLQPIAILRVAAQLVEANRI